MRVGERGPVGHRARQPGRVAGGDLGAQRLAEEPHAPRQDLWVRVGGVLRLDRGLDPRVIGQQFLAGHVQPARPRPWAKSGQQAGLPVDQGAVAVKAQGFKIGEFHRS